MRRQLALFDLEAFTSSPTINTAYDPSWDETQTTTHTVLEQVTPDTPNRSNLDSSVLEQAKTDTRQSAPEHNHWIEKYPVTRYGKEHYYYRYLWMSGRKIHHIHIRGGNVESAIAKSRKLEVESAISDGLSPTEIVQLIRQWKSSVETS